MKVSRECSPIFKFVNTSQVGRVMSRERNEHPVESVMESSLKSFIYRHCYSNLKKKKRDSDTGITLTSTGTTLTSTGTT